MNALTGPDILLRSISSGESAPLRPAQGAASPARFQEIRRVTERIVAPLTTEDSVVSSTGDTSPPKWHLAHTTWFFERMLLRRFIPEYETRRPEYDYLFNSYYETAGAFLPKRKRAELSRPGLAEILEYRAEVSEAVSRAWSKLQKNSAALNVLELGLQHEQQHQELLLMDIKRNFFANPLRPTYRKGEARPRRLPRVPRFLEFGGGKHEIGFAGEGFAYDNESGRHPVWVSPFALSRDLVSNGEFLEFVESGGYQDPRHWLADGWDQVRRESWSAPLYWQKEGGTWREMTLAGMQPLDLAQPVCHVSYYEALAFAHWKGARLPTEAEWEVAAATVPVRGHFLEEEDFQPRPPADEEGLAQMHGTLWEWTGSAYLPYPGYRPYEQELAEYNGKFMCNQMVVRGGACVTPQSHYRPTYRNFFYPQMRWQFCGFRLARDL